MCRPTFLGGGVLSWQLSGCGGVSFDVVFRAKVANKTAIVILSIVCEEDHPHKTEQ